MANMQNQVPTFTIRHSDDATGPQTLPSGISQYTIDSSITQATRYNYPRSTLYLRFYDGPRPHTTVVLGCRKKPLHIHVVDGKKKYAEVMAVMERSVKSGWYRQVEVEREEGGGEVFVKKWVCLRDGRGIIVGEWERPPVEDGW